MSAFLRNIGSVSRAESIAFGSRAGRRKVGGKFFRNIGPLRASTASADTDPNFSFVISLLHFDGADTSTTFTDEKGKTWAANGNAQLDTAQFKFGTASLLLDGTGDFADTGTSADWDLGTGDFTIQTWKRHAALPSSGNYSIILSSDNDTAGARGIPYFGIKNAAGTYKAALTDSANSIEALSNGLSLSVDTWNHIETGRSGNTVYFFLDGVAAGTFDVTGKSFNFDVDAGGVLIGAQGQVASPIGGYVNGWLDDFVVHKGVCLHTSGFTPRTSAWPNS